MNLRLLFVLILLIGIGLFCYSFKLPHYLDQKAYDKLELNARDAMMKNDKNYRQVFSEKQAALMTNKNNYEDVGSGLAVTSFVILLFLVINRTKYIKDLKKIKSITNIWVYVLANFSWVLLIPAVICDFTYQDERGDFAFFNDSVAHAIMGIIFLVFLGIIPLNIFILLATKSNNIPSNLFALPVKYSGKETLKELFWGFWLLFNSLILVGLIIGGDHLAIIVNLIFTYILLSLRAGQIDREQISIESIPTTPS